mmetsp:Transcript_44987/g.150214  ORF Transcript_44987/g.150214 Transcript_44987/m.150214 type:complete len:160 (-) Transcript_44987:141-620(-)
MAPAPPPCEEKICASKNDKMRAMFAAVGQPKPAPAATSDECPPDREELGRHTWTLLHTTAAYYPEKASLSQQSLAEQFIRSLGELYACSHCAADFRSEVEASPPRLGSREEFCLWMCEQHNAVNAKLGKPVFPCTLARLDARWRDGGARCDEEGAESLG